MDLHVRVRALNSCIVRQAGWHEKYVGTSYTGGSPPFRENWLIYRKKSNENAETYRRTGYRAIVAGARQLPILLPHVPEGGMPSPLRTPEALTNLGG